jgi:hypothetical protein
MAVLAVGAVGATYALRAYLTPARSLDLLRDTLSSLLDTSVEIESVDLALWGNSSLQGLRVGDYLTADHVTADVSVVRRFPSQLKLQGVKLHLRFDAEGNLLTQLPPDSGDSRLPNVQIEDATLILDQAGRVPLTLRGAQLAMSANGAISGVLADPEWGTFEVTGEYRLDPTHLHISIRQEQTRLRAELLQRLPFVPRELWETLRAEGDAVPLVAQFDIGQRVEYRVGFEQVRVTLLQPDRPHFRAQGAAGELHGDDSGAFHLQGTADDPRYGSWRVQVDHDAASGAIDIGMQTQKPVVVTQAKLEELPYVPKNVWDNIQATGVSDARVQLRLWSTKSDVSYRIALEPLVDRVFIAAIHLTATKVTGKVEIEDGLVKLDDVRGVAANGTVKTRGTLDFRDETTSTMSFGLQVERLRLQQLPRQWELPQQITGQINGAADITVRVGPDGIPTTTGTGSGRITGAAIGVVPILAPIELELYDERGRLRFRTGKQATLPGLLGGLSLGLTYLEMEEEAEAQPKPALPSAGELASRAGDAVLWLSRGLAQGAKQGADTLVRLERATRPGQDTTYLDAKFRLDDVDLVTLAKQFQLEVPEEIRGKASVDLTASIPINNARDFSAYRLVGTVRSPRLEVVGYAVENVQADIRYRDGLARLTNLSARFGGSAIRGEVAAQLAPRQGDLTLDLEVTGLDVRPLAPAEYRRSVAGRVRGRIRAQVPVADAGRIEAWRGTAVVGSDRLDLLDLPFRQLTGGLTLFRGTLGVVELRGDFLGSVLTARGALNLTGDNAYEARLNIRGFDMAQLAMVVPTEWSRLEVLGHIDASGTFKGNLRDGPQGAGRTRIVGLRLGNIVTGAIQSRWNLQGDRLAFEDLQGQLFGGLLTGKGFVTPRDGSFSLYLAGVDAAEAARRVPEVDFPIRGRVNLKTSLTFGFDPLQADVAIDVKESQLTVARVPVRELRGTARVRQGRISYNAQGDMLGGRLSVEGRYPPPPLSAVDQYHGRLRVDRVYLGRLISVFEPELPAGRWRGTVSVDLPYRFDGVGGSLTSRGRFEIRDVRYNDNEITDSLIGDVRLLRDGVLIRDVSGTIASGLFRLRGAYRFEDESRSWFNLTLNNANANILEKIVNGPAARSSGTLDLQMRGRLGSEWRGTGEARLTRGALQGVAVSEWTQPLDFTFTPLRGAGELIFRESRARVGDGRARIRGRLTWSETIRLEGNILLRDASVAALSGVLGDVTGYVQGKISGRVDFGSGEIRSLQDVRATVQLTLRETQALQLPVLRQLAPLLLLPGGRATTFNEGELRGKLAGGIFRIDRFTLESAIAQLFIDGNITLAGRLDLEVVARTAALGPINPVGLRALAARIPAVGPIPVVLVTQLSELLSARVLHLRVRGTTRAPVIQAEPLRLLNQEAARFLLTRLAR